MDQRALLLAGGSSRGIIQVGVLASIINKEPEIEYTFIGGNSVGAINAAFLAQFPIGDFPLAVDRLASLWFGLEGDRSIYRANLFSVLRYIWDNGFADPEPLKKLIQERFDPGLVRENGRKLRISTVDLLSGMYMEFGETEATWEHIYGSASMPYAFPAILTSDNKYYLTDGGVLKVAPIKTAIDLGYRKIDIVLNSPIERSKRVHCKSVKGVKRVDRYATRVLELILDHQFVLDMKLCLAYNLLSKANITRHREVDVRVFAPKEVLSDEMILVDFSPDILREWYNDSLQITPVDLEEFLSKVG